MRSQRYLLCRPRGGLNDTLCRIALCWEYAKRFQRKLIIDCQKSSLFGHFSDYFCVRDSTDDVIPSLNAELLQQLAPLSCRPASLRGSLEAYPVRFQNGVGYVHAHTGNPTRFCNTYPMQFVDDFPEDVLVYEDSGGGTASFGLLSHLVLNRSLLAEVEQTLQRLPPRYCAVHIRNTDYRSDYRRILRKIRSQVAAMPLLVCSDDPAVIDYAAQVFPRRVLRTPRSVQSRHSTGRIHEGALTSPHDRTRAAAEAIIDLVCLANATTLYAGRVSSVFRPMVESVKSEMFRPISVVSGFSALAQYLCSNKHILDALLGRLEHVRRPADPAAAVLVDTRSVVRRALSRGLSVARVVAQRWR
jgi:hypothetical protein